VAHHLSLLSLPPVLEVALTSGRCTSPRTLHELSKLHDEDPGRVADLVASDQPITCEVVAAARDAAPAPVDVGPAASSAPSRLDQLSQMVRRTEALCERLDASIARLLKTGTPQIAPDDLAALRRRVAELASRLGSSGRAQGKRWVREIDNVTRHPRERVTIDLRGIGPRLHAHAAARGKTTASVVRGAVVAMLDAEGPPRSQVLAPSRSTHGQSR
jgi:hypothetical protein